MNFRCWRELCCANQVFSRLTLGRIGGIVKLAVSSGHVHREPIVSGLVGRRQARSSRLKGDDKNAIWHGCKLGYWLPYNTKPRNSLKSANMRALLVVAHGSRRSESNNEVRRLTDKLRTIAGEDYQRVECAFLELSDPSIPQGIDCCVAGGASEVVILPYFLSAGRHVAKDIPEIVEASRAEHPEVALRIAPYLGQANSLVDSLLELSKK